MQSLHKKLTNNHKGIFFGVLTSIAFATYILINRYVYTNYVVEPFNYTATFVISGAAFAALGLAFNYIKQKYSIFEKSILPIVANGLIAGVAIGLVVFGQQYTTAINTSIIVTATVLTTVLFSKLLLKETFSRAQQLWLLIMFVGLYTAIVGVHSIKLNKGDLIILSSCLIFGFTNTYSRILMRKNSSGFIADVRLLSGGLLFIILGIIVSRNDFLVTSTGLWPILSGFFFWLTIKFFYASIRYTNPNKAIVLSNSHPIFTPIVGVILLSEPYSWTKLVGSITIIVSVYFISKA